jgi:peptide/nickel transport system substrate-binding protein
MRKLFLVIVAAVLTISLLLGSCGTSSTTTTTAPPATSSTATQPPTQTTTTTTKPPTQTTTTQPPTGAAPYGTIRIANADFGNESFDPINLAVWGWYIYDRLVTQDSTGKVVPNVAESFEFDPNTGKWTFHIRHGIKFHNGDPLTAEDVKFSIDRFGDLSLGFNPWMPYISAGYNKVETRIIDDYTVEFIADHPELQQGIVFAQVMILPKKLLEAQGMDEFRKHPIGSGPWKFVELIPKTKLTLEANTDYWGQVPAFKNLVEQMVPEQSTRIAMLKAGDVDMVLPQTGIDFERIAELEQQGFRTVNLGLPSSYTIAYQATWLESAGPVHDIRVRQAMSYALNRQEISDTWFQGYAKPGAQFFMHQGGNGVPPSYGWSDDLLSEPYDLAKAKALLAEAGYPDNWADPTIHIYGPPYQADFLLVLIGYWQAAGLQVKLEVEDLAVYQGMLFTRPKEGDQNVGWIWPWTSPDPFNCTYHSANMYTTYGVHGTSNSEEATQKYIDYLKITDPVESEKAWNDFQKYVKTLWINLGIVEIDPVYVAGPELGEFPGFNWMSNQEALNGVQHPK